MGRRCCTAALVVAVLAVTSGAPAGIAAPGAPPQARPAPAVAGVAGVVPQDPWPGASGPAPGPVAEPRVLARAAVLADESTGQVLFERAARQPRAMASTTKVMTALLTLERLDQRRVVVIGTGPPRVGEESLRLRRGERLTVRQLLLGLLVKSANDAGVALAEAVDGSEAAFVRRMNRRAAELRLAATHYVTPYGLDRTGHRTSARDLARLWETAMRRADFRALVATREVRLPGGPLRLRRFVNSNQLLGAYRWTAGGKTGYTNLAGRCLVASASRGGRRLVAVALGSPDAFADVRALFEYGFSRFVRVRLAAKGQAVSLGPARPAALRVEADVDALLRLDQLGGVRLAATAPAGATGEVASAWFVAGRRLVPLRLGRLPAAGPAPTSTLAAPPASAGPPGTTAPASAAGGAGPLAATLVAGTAVRPWPVPPGAPAPAIDAFLRREPP
ncbi:MAG TPA: D-alanyl-D-alanine carboxypeptidase family protein [Actinomycetota bacterium]|nr:D-alanyl-D-alanine carboxypeptidase family protein [Actinomycetota bacterium]